ncbi:MAG: hypothetical protein JXR83_14895 [Deltaproteobacteria bacterium]|nr:hypothetical protein [Deltaproteobacteria bacterium]
MVTRLMTLHTSLTATSTELLPRTGADRRELLAAGERSEPWAELLCRAGVGRPLTRRE